MSRQTFILESRHCGRWLIAAAMLLVAGGSNCVWAVEEPASVEAFVQEREKWPRMQGVTLTIEGRRLILNDDRLTMTNCDLVFLFAEGVEAPNARGKGVNVEVTGHLETYEGRLVFRVTQLRVLPSDMETLARRRAALPANDAAGWYALADWAEGRGRFYEDAALQASAQELRRTGLLIEYRQVEVTDVARLYGLAEKARQLKLPDDVRQQIVHDALRRELQTARQDDAKKYDVVLTKLLEELQGAGQPIKLDDATQRLREQYRDDPLRVYERADEATRRQLHRLMYIDTALERIEQDALPDGRNGYEIARRIEQSVPEYASKADEFRQREITWQMKRLAELSREDLLLLASRLEQRGQAAEVEEVKRRWLQAQEPKFRERGANGQFDLAEEYVTLLGDRESASEIYKRLYEQRTTQEAARLRLVELGYRYDGRQWSRPADGEPDQIADAIRRGVVRRGMTAEQVRAALGGSPTSVVKFAARGQIAELWVYAEHGISIEFTRRGADSESTAQEIHDLTVR